MLCSGRQQGFEITVFTYYVGGPHLSLSGPGGNHILYDNLFSIGDVCIRNETMLQDTLSTNNVSGDDSSTRAVQARDQNFAACSTKRSLIRNDSVGT